MYREVDINYIVQRMIKKIWLAIIAGLAGAILFTVFSNRANNNNASTVNSYSGDYLQRAETNRYAVYAIYEEEVVLPSGNINAPSYDLELLTNVIKNRLQSSLFAENLYKEMRSHISDFDDSGMTTKTIQDEMLQTSIENDYVLTIKVLSPPDSIFGDDVSKNCKYRDLLFDLVAQDIEGGNLFGDLPIHLERADKEIELLLSEQEFKENYLEEKKPVSIKHIVFVFALGFALAEAVIIIAAIMNNTVKSSKDLSNNTDLLVLGEIQQEMIDKDITRLTSVLKSRNLSGKNMTMVTIGDVHMDFKAFEHQMVKELETGKFTIVDSKDVYDNSIECLSGNTIILIVEPLVSSYNELDSIAKLFVRTNTTTEGAIVYVNSNEGVK